MPNENKTINKDDHYLLLTTLYKFSDRYDFVKSINEIELTDDKKINVSILKHKKTGQHILIAPILSPAEIAVLHHNIQDQHTNLPIDISYYSCDARTDTTSDLINLTDIHFIKLTPEKAQFHVDTRGDEKLKNDDQFGEHYEPILALANKNTVINYGEAPNSTTYGAQYNKPIARDIGLPALKRNQELADGIRNPFHHFMSHEELQALKTFHEENQLNYNPDSIYNMGPEAAYFYLAGFLHNPISGFQSNYIQSKAQTILLNKADIPDNVSDLNSTSEDGLSLEQKRFIFESKGILTLPNWTADPDDIPEVGRVFYDPNSHRLIAIMAPGYDADDSNMVIVRKQVESKCDTVIKTDYKEGYVNGMLKTLSSIGIQLTEADEFMALLFDNAPKDPRATRNSEQPVERTLSHLKPWDALTPNQSIVEEDGEMADEATPMTPPRRSTPKTWESAQRTPARNSVQQRARSSSIRGTPRANTNKDEKTLETASKFVTNTNARLTAEQYYVATAGLLQNYAYRETDIYQGSEMLRSGAGRNTTQLSELSRQFAKADNSKAITIYKPCTLDEAIQHYKENNIVEDKANHTFIYIIKEPNKPLAIFCIDNESPTLLTPTLDGKLPNPWDEYKQTEIALTADEPQKTQLERTQVKCDSLAEEHNLFFELHNHLSRLRIFGAANRIFDQLGTRPDKSTVIAFHNKQLSTSDNNNRVIFNDKRAEPINIGIRISPELKDFADKSAAIPAYQQIVKEAYAAGMLLVSRITDEEHTDLAFIFKQPGADKYSVIYHPTHKYLLPKQVIKEKVITELRRRGIPSNQVQFLKFSLTDSASLNLREKAAKKIRHAIGNRRAPIQAPHKQVYQDETRQLSQATNTLKTAKSDEGDPIESYAAKAFGEQSKQAQTSPHLCEHQHVEGTHKGSNYTAAMIAKHVTQYQGEPTRYDVLLHPHHSKSVSRSKLLNIVRQKIRETHPNTDIPYENKCLNAYDRKGQHVAEYHIKTFKDDPNPSPEGLVIAKKPGYHPEEVHYKRTHYTHTKATEALTDAGMQALGFKKQTQIFGSKITYQYKNTALQPSNSKPNIWRRFVTHVSRHRFKYSTGFLLISGGVVAGLSFGAALIPLLIAYGVFIGLGIGELSMVVDAVRVQRADTRIKAKTAAINDEASSSYEKMERLLQTKPQVHSPNPPGTARGLSFEPPTNSDPANKAELTRTESSNSIQSLTHTSDA